MKRQIEDDIPPEVDFSNGVRGKYAGQLMRKTIYVPLDEDVSRAFHTREEVNAALRKMMRAEGEGSAVEQKAS